MQCMAEGMNVMGWTYLGLKSEKIHSVWSDYQFGGCEIHWMAIFMGHCTQVKTIDQKTSFSGFTFDEVELSINRMSA